MNFALNHMSAPRLDCRSFIDLAASLGCIGIELRNDLADKKLTERPFFDGEAPATIGAYARDKGLRLLGLSEAYGFNVWSDAMRVKVDLLIAQAKESGAESISLIPSNDGARMNDEDRLGKLRGALREILPMLEEADMIALIEPLGFTTSSLRLKSEAVEAIEAVGGATRYRLVHDTFHHHLAGSGPIFPNHTGIVHISGVVDPSLAPEAMQDGHRILVDENDRLRNIEQIRALSAAGYTGAFSYEPFSRAVHTHDDIAWALQESMSFIRSRL
ncbi:MAG: TIM barrel protein [Hoeflea sp.]|nr:TIM barrel protein [Hoeflea sp.]MBV1762062.1 TIM barrel protein [Hoeflea sp.]MBV1783450.1 TIM barrel protein [Hoeflea sp.]